MDPENKPDPPEAQVEIVSVLKMTETNEAPTKEDEQPIPDVPDAPSNAPAATADDDDNAGEQSSVKVAAATTPETEARNAWDHSDRRVHVQGVDKYATRKDLMKLATKWAADMVQPLSATELTPVEILKIKKPPNETWMIIQLSDKVAAKSLMDYVNANQLTNKKNTRTLTARLLSEMQVNKRNLPPDDMAESRLTKRQKQAVAADAADKSSSRIAPEHRPVSDDEIKDKIIPLWRLSPAEQNQTKTKLMINQCALKIHKELKKRFRDLQKHKKNSKDSTVPKYEWMEGKRAIEIEEVVAVPNVVRNKCEFTFGWRYFYADPGTAAVDDTDMKLEAEAPAPGNPDEPCDNKVNSAAEDTQATESRPIQRTPAVGMMAAGWAGGVSRPHCCENISSEACAVVDMVDQFLLDSPLPPYDTKSHQGIWRLLTVRSSRVTRECMVVITMCPATGGVGEDGKEYTDHYDAEKSRLLSLLTDAKLPVPEQDPVHITSIFFQEFDGLSSPSSETPVMHAHGKTHMLEKLGNCTFQISPGAFFQVNSVGAEMLYAKVVEKVREVTASASDKTLLFDVCCGTGTIGLCCMKEGAVDQVIGVDISEPAIQNAKANAKLNEFYSDKVRFVAGRAEDVLSKEIAKARRESEDCQFVAVVDPAREGLHPDVVRALRMTQKISRIVYVSCNPTGSLVNDLGLFCAPPSKKYTGRPFKIASATPYDMFPMTNHCEMVMVLDRMSEDECEGKVDQPKVCSAVEAEPVVATDAVAAAEASH